MNPQELKDRANEIVRELRERFGEAYDSAAEWMEDNSITLFAVGGGIILAGLATYFIATRRKKVTVDVGVSSDKAA